VFVASFVVPSWRRKLNAEVTEIAARNDCLCTAIRQFLVVLREFIHPQISQISTDSFRLALNL
jgi:hypothetical protein